MWKQKLSNRCVLITGGLGFIGLNLARVLVEKYSSKVIIVDDCSNSSPDSLNELQSDVEFHNISVCNREKLRPLLKRAEYIFHFATKGISGAAVSPEEDMETTVVSTLNILEDLRREKPGNFQNLIFTSTSSIYGNGDSLPFTEETKPDILSNYAGTKYLAENYVSLYNKTYNIPSVVLRLSNVFGPGQSPHNQYCGVIGKFIYNALKDKPAIIYSDGKQTRDYTYINDTIEAMLLTSTHPDAIGEVYNVGTGTETSVIDLIESISLFIPGIRTENADDQIADDINRRIISYEKIKSQLGWEPKYTLESGIKDSMTYYKNLVNAEKLSA